MTNGIIDSSQKIITNGLQLNFDAAQLRSYAGSGTTINDLSGNNRNGSLINGVGFNSSNGGSLVFDGVNDNVNCGNILNIGLNSWTVSCWVKLNTGSGTMGIIGKTSQRSYVGRYAIWIESNLINSIFQPASNYMVTTSVIPYVDSKFHNITLTINRTGLMTLYVDSNSVGTPVDISSTSGVNMNTSTDFLYLGAYGNNTGQVPALFLNGNIGQAQIYNRALTSTEILQNFNANKKRYGL